MTRNAGSRSTEFLWRIALGGTALVAVATPMLFVDLARDLGWRGTFWWSAFAIFVLAWLMAQRRGAKAGARPASADLLALLLVQSATALAANWAIPTVLPGVATGGVLLVLVAAQLGALRFATGLTWVVIQCLGLLAIYLQVWAAPIAWTAGSAYAAFQVGMLGVARLAERERTLREELAGTLAELLSTRALLESSVRGAERTRIARELHDLLGHHLVALGLQLEAASMEAPGPSKARVAECRALARLLLADVRSAVSDLREDATVDLRGALMALGSGGAEGAAAAVGVGPTIEVRVASGFAIDDPARAMAFLRCAQEAVTNARRHAAASRIVVEVDSDTLRVRDDGRGIGNASEGAGLRGMRERAAAFGGEVVVESAAGGGTEVRVRLPAEVGP